jgi:beta-xylosidase
MIIGKYRLAHGTLFITNLSSTLGIPGNEIFGYYSDDSSLENEEFDAEVIEDEEGEEYFMWKEDKVYISDIVK